MKTKAAGIGLALLAIAFAVQANQEERCVEVGPNNTVAQCNSVVVALYIDGKRELLALGPTLRVLDGKLSAARQYNKRLQWSQNAWTVPPAAANVVIHCNGVRYTPGVDYTIDSLGRITPINSNMQPEDVVTADYDL